MSKHIDGARRCAVIKGRVCRDIVTARSVLRRLKIDASATAVETAEVT